MSTAVRLSRYSKRQTASFRDLPCGVVAVVLSFLPIRDCFFTTDLVCKAFHQAGRHPMCWPDDRWAVLTTKTNVASAVKYFIDLGFTPNIRIAGAASIYYTFQWRSLPSDIRRLEMSFIKPEVVEWTATLLSSLSQLETFKANNVVSESFRFPTCVTMAQLKEVELRSNWLLEIQNMDTAHLPLLSDLKIVCSELEQSSFPDSLKKLTLIVYKCSPAVLTNIAKLPILEELYMSTVEGILSQPELIFTSTLNTFGLGASPVSSVFCSGEVLGNKARESLCRMARLTSLNVDSLQVSIADLEAISSLPSLTKLEVQNTTYFNDAQLAHLLPLGSLRFLHASSIPSPLFRFFCRPNLTSLSLLCCEQRIICLAPLTACVNLTTLNTDVRLIEKNALIVSHLTKLEKVQVHVTCETSITHLCKLPRLKKLAIHSAERVGPLSLQALAGLAHTIEKLKLPCLRDPQAAVLTISQLKKLEFFQTESKLSQQQIAHLRYNLPRMFQVVNGHGSMDTTWSSSSS